MGKVSSFIVSLALFAILGTGCATFPMGTEKYTAEFPSDIRPSGQIQEKAYAVDVDVGEADKSHHAVTIGLAGKVTKTYLQVQHYKSVTVEKKKKLAFGLNPGAAENSLLFNDRKLLRSTYGMENQNGIYRGTDATQLNFLGFFLYVPVALLYEPFFGSWECDSHHWVGPNSEYLKFFPPEERRKIGAWTNEEEESHSQSMFWSGFTHSAAIGFHRYCDYEIHDPVESQRTTPAPSKTITIDRKVMGPYAVTLNLPSLDYSKTVAVPLGRTSASFPLPKASNGVPFANGTIRFQPPPEGLDSVRNEDDRALLKLAVEHDWPVAVVLPKN